MRRTATGVLIPAEVAGDHWRARALTHVLGHYAQHHGDWHVSLADGAREGWCKGAAVARARHGIAADVFVVADADVIVDPDALTTAVDAVRSGAPWAMPHEQVYRLTARLTERLYATRQLPDELDLDRAAYLGIEAGGLIVVSRDVLHACPIDPRFVGWGSEDVCWGHALRCLFGAPWRDTRAPLWHLHHPHASPGQQRNLSVEGRELHRRYQQAHNNPAAMRAILAEVLTG